MSRAHTAPRSWRSFSRHPWTVAAIVKGCVDFDPDLDVAGVILNRVAGKRHLGILRDSIREYTGLAVLGAIPNLGDDSVLIPGRHLGLVTPSEYEDDGDLRARLREIAEGSLDVDGLIEVAKAAGPLSCAAADPPRSRETPGRVKIGYFKDSVFTFYYPENLEALEANGAGLIPISSLADRSLPEVDALYIGGGFPETHVEQLARNRSMMQVRRRRLPDERRVSDRSAHAPEARGTWLHAAPGGHTQSVLRGRRFDSWARVPLLGANRRSAAAG
jgi:cobyrinic acid a,c-diamide synthase